MISSRRSTICALMRREMSFLSVVSCIVFSFKNNFFLRETRDGLKAFSGADMSRARPHRVHCRPLTGSTAGITPVVKARVEWGKKWRKNDFGREHRMEGLAES